MGPVSEIELRAQIAVLRSTVARLRRENSAMRDREMAWSNELTEIRKERDAWKAIAQVPHVD